MKSLYRMFLGLLSISIFIMCNAAQPKQDKPTSVEPAAASTKAKIIVYYFHGDARCPTCFMLESLAKSEIETNFADAIKQGTLEWKTINIDTKGNEHYAQDYKLYTKSIIISTQVNNKEASWKNLDKIWQLVHEEPKYRSYIKTEVAACLAGKCL